MNKKLAVRKVKNRRQFYGDDLQALGNEDSIGYLIKRSHVLIIRNIDTELAPFDLTSKQWIPLQVIGQGRGDTVATIAREAGIDGGAMTRMLDRLEAKGLVKRIRRTDDRRVVNIELTKTGKELVDHIPEAIYKVLNQLLSGFNKSEFTQLKNLLSRMIINGENSVV